MERVGIAGAISFLELFKMQERNPLFVRVEGNIANCPIPGIHLIGLGL